MLRFILLLVVTAINCIQYTSKDLELINYVETHGFQLPYDDDGEYWIQETKKLSK